MSSTSGMLMSLTTTSIAASSIACRAFAPVGRLYHLVAGAPDAAPDGLTNTPIVLDYQNAGHATSPDSWASAKMGVPGVV
jgi:hypothetical protein